MGAFPVIRDAPLTGAQIEALRVAVGWDSMVGQYDQILSHSYTHFSVSDGDKLIAFVNVISDGLADALLVDLMVHPDYQGQGIGRTLVQSAIDTLTTAGIRCIEVLFEPHLESFYRACGFHILEAGMIDNQGHLYSQPGIKPGPPLAYRAARGPR